MEAAFFVYLMDILANFGTTLGLVGFIGVLSTAAYSFIYLLGKSDRPDLKYLNWPWIASGIAIVIACLIPSTKTMYLMVGLVYSEKALESSIGRKAMEVIELKIDEEIAKLKPVVTK
jgi:hypothetical protein